MLHYLRALTFFLHIYEYIYVTIWYWWYIQHICIYSHICIYEYIYVLVTQMIVKYTFIYIYFHTWLLLFRWARIAEVTDMSTYKYHPGHINILNCSMAFISASSVWQHTVLPWSNGYYLKFCHSVGVRWEIPLYYIICISWLLLSFFSYSCHFLIQSQAKMEVQVTLTLGDAFLLETVWAAKGLAILPLVKSTGEEDQTHLSPIALDLSEHSRHSSASLQSPFGQEEGKGPKNNCHFHCVLPSLSLQ